MTFLARTAMTTAIAFSCVTAFTFVLRSNHTDLMMIASHPEICADTTCSDPTRASQPPQFVAVAYLRCSEEATRRILSRPEIEACAAAYLDLKLSFLTDITPDSFSRMTLTERIRTNRRGYLSYLLWKTQERASYERLRQIVLSDLSKSS